MNVEFVHDERLGIPLPVLHQDWERISETERAHVLAHWEQIRGRIPDRIKAIELTIVEKQCQLDTELNFQVSCRLNFEIAELASTITDLHLWYRVHQEITAKSHQ